MVRDEELAAIRSGLATGLHLRPHSGIAVGIRVQVRTGVFAGVEGIVTELRKQCRVIISLAAAHQCFSLEAAIDDLLILSKPESKPRLNPVPAYGY
jgi:hypothetical protein